MRFQEEAKISQKGLRIGDDGIAEKNDAEESELARQRKKLPVTRPNHVWNCVQMVLRTLITCSGVWEI